jgi:hypothetical protein
VIVRKGAIAWPETAGAKHRNDALYVWNEPAARHRDKTSFHVRKLSFDQLPSYQRVLDARTSAPQSGGYS